MMSNIDASVSTGVPQSVNGYGTHESTEIIKNASVASKDNAENLRCFVCDAKVQGRRYSLATCKTQNSRSRIIEKLGELVGERYVVVISEDDVICRSCAILMNTLDRLECEMKKVKAAVLRFLECKYSLAEGELLDSSNVAKPCQPPQITKSDSGDYHSRKRGPVSLDDDDSTKKAKKSVWMRCDKCKYTTAYDTYMVHHVRQHLKQKVHCDKCRVEYPEAKLKTHWCKTRDNGNLSGDIENIAKVDPHVIQTGPLETPDFTTVVNEVDGSVTLPLLTIQPDAEPSTSIKDEPIQLINLTNQNSLQFQNILANDGSIRSGQPMLMRVLQQFGVGDDFGQSVLIPTTNSDTSMSIKPKENSTKQMLTLAADGSLEMVAVDCWDDINPQDPDPDMTF